MNLHEVGWFVGTFAYREIARGRTATGTRPCGRHSSEWSMVCTGGLRLSLLLWTLPLLAKAAWVVLEGRADACCLRTEVLLLAVDETMAFPAAMLENPSS